MKRLSIDRSGGQTQNFKQRIKLFARNLLTVVMPKLPTASSEQG